MEILDKKLIKSFLKIEENHEEIKVFDEHPCKAPEPYNDIELCDAKTNEIIEFEIMDSLKQIKVSNSKKI